jgi:hypothetical protein
MIATGNHRMTNLDWPAFLGRHDPVWQFQPQNWGQGAFLGNGLLGAMIYSGGLDQHRNKSNVLRWELGRVDVTAQGDDSGYLQPRVLIGDFLLEPRGIMTWEDCRMRLDLWNAEVNGVVPCQEGEIRFRSFIHATRPVVVVELHGTGSETEPRFDFHPQHGASPWVHYRDGESLAKIPLPPQPVRSRKAAIELSTQTFLSGGQCVTAWREVPLPDGGKRLFVSIGLDLDGASAQAEAARAVEEAVAEDWEAFVLSHRAWWQEYYPLSFLSVPDTRLEGFYWMQVYKLGAATRPEQPVLDVLGPWMTLTPWPGVWWNLNVQFTYSPLYAANRLALAESLPNTLQKHFGNLIANAPEAFQSDSAALGRASTYDCKAPAGLGGEMGNLIYVCHNLWRHYRSTMDDAFLRELLFPLLRRGIRLYLHLLDEGTDGFLHLPATHSPEYSGHQNLTTRDCNYDLAMLRWGCSTLLAASSRLGIDDELAPRWREVLQRLVPFPQDEHGLKIGKDLPFTYGHRHYCHLVSGYPLFVLDLENISERKLFEKSLATWLGREGAFSGFSFTYAASAFAHLGRADEALACLRIVLDHWIQPNTMYCEKGPVLETPLHAADALHDLLLQSNRGCIHVFPAIPSGWDDVCFAHLRAEGSFLVSALRRGGLTRVVKVIGLSGEPCCLRCDLRSPIVVIEGREASATPRNGLLELSLEQGQSAEIREHGDTAVYAFSPVDSSPALHNFYGSPKPWRLQMLPESALRP